MLRLGHKAVWAMGVALASILPVVGETHFAEKVDSVEVPAGTKLCDPAEDVYGFYLVKSDLKPDGTQEAEYYRFGAQPDPRTGAPEHILQRSLMVRVRKHPHDQDKLEVIDAAT